jgi:hypothetical protein
MGSAEWHGCQDPQGTLDFLRVERPSSPAQARLFVAALNSGTYFLTNKPATPSR